jgi:hypothetical protein
MCNSYSVPHPKIVGLREPGRLMSERRSGFWSTMPGILTGVAALITAITGYLAFSHVSAPGPAPAPTVTQPAALADPQAQASTASNLPATEANATSPRNDEVRATIVDPDGWTNLRSGPSVSSAVVGQIRAGEIFWTRPRDGLWWPARTEDGQMGFVHRSRVRLNP